jgi:transposase
LTGWWVCGIVGTSSQEKKSESTTKRLKKSKKSVEKKTELSFNRGKSRRKLDSKEEKLRRVEDKTAR